MLGVGGRGLECVGGGRKKSAFYGHEDLQHYLIKRCTYDALSCIFVFFSKIIATDKKYPY